MIYNNKFLIFKNMLKYPSISKSIIYRQFLYKLYSNSLLNRGKVKTLPAEIVLLASRKCFLNCIMCGTKALYNSDDFFTDFIELKYIKKIVDEISQYHHPIYVKITGGEPMMHPDFEEIIDYFHFKKVPVRLCTNGILLKSSDKVKSIIDSGVEVITISVDGTQATHNKIRQPKASNNKLYEIIYKGLNNISEYKKNKKTNFPLVQFACTISSMNYKELENYVNELNNIDIQWLHFSFLQHITEKNGLKSEKVITELGGVGDSKWRFFHDAPYKVFNMDLEILEDQLNIIFSKKHKFPISILNIKGLDKKSLYRYHHTDNQIHNSLCANVYLSCVILAPGYFTFCIDFPQFFYGDIRKHSIKEAWFSEKAQDFRSKFRKYYYNNDKTNMPHCLRCLWRFW